MIRSLLEVSAKSIHFWGRTWDAIGNGWEEAWEVPSRLAFETILLHGNIVALIQPPDSFQKCRKFSPPVDIFIKFSFSSFRSVPF